MIAAQSDRTVQRHIGSGEGSSSPHGTNTGDEHDGEDYDDDDDDDVDDVEEEEEEKGYDDEI